MTRHPDGWYFGQMGIGTVWHVVRTAGREPNFLPCKLCRIFWKYFWIAESLLNSIFTKKWFCPTECGQLQTNNAAYFLLRRTSMLVIPKGLKNLYTSMAYSYDICINECISSKISSWIQSAFVYHISYETFKEWFPLIVAIIVNVR